VAVLCFCYAEVVIPIHDLLNKRPGGAIRPGRLLYPELALWCVSCGLARSGCGMWASGAENGLSQACVCMACWLFLSGRMDGTIHR